MRLVDLSPKRRVQVVGDAVTSILAVATKPLATRKLTELVCAHLDTAEVSLVTPAILKLKATHGARVTGKTFKNAFGHTCQTYVWSATPLPPDAEVAREAVVALDGAPSAMKRVSELEAEIARLRAALIDKDEPQVEEDNRPPLSNDERIARVAADFGISVAEYRRQLEDGTLGKVVTRPVIPAERQEPRPDVDVSHRIADLKRAAGPIPVEDDPMFSDSEEEEW